MFKEETKIEPNLKRQFTTEPPSVIISEHFTEENKEDEDMEEFKAYLKAKHPDD